MSCIDKSIIPETAAVTTVPIAYLEQLHSGIEAEVDTGLETHEHKDNVTGRVFLPYGMPH